MLSSILALLHSLFYPHSCPGCGEEVRGKGVLCDPCRRGIWHPRSFQPLSLDCPHLDGLFFLMDYAGASRKPCRWPSSGEGRTCCPGWRKNGGRGFSGNKDSTGIWCRKSGWQPPASLRTRCGRNSEDTTCRKKSSGPGADRKGTFGKTC